MVHLNQNNNVQDNQIDKFNQFLAQAQAKDENDPYEIDLQSNLENIGHAYDLEKATMISACGCMTAVVTQCC